MAAPVDDMYDCIVIGSGFGGSVMAYRLAKAGKTVLVLERGQEFAPGSFPRTPLESSTNVWDPHMKLYGLFDIWSFDKFEAIVSSGVGGGSLIYANVMMRRPKEWFDPEVWPVSYEDLEKPYGEVETMLGVNPFPYPNETFKFQHLSSAAAKQKMTWEPAPIAVSFSPEGAPRGSALPIVNRDDPPRSTCVSCGQCNAGCNLGSKNSMDLTYLSSAKTHGARIETLHDVRRIRPLPDGGYEVESVLHVPPDPVWERDGPRPVPNRVQFRARSVVLAAGSLGSTYLLLRNRVRLPLLSRSLGTRFSGNGDYLGFIRTNNATVMESSRAPVITGYFKDGGRPGNQSQIRGHVVQDGGYPALFGWLGESIGPRPIKRVIDVALTLAWARLTNVSRTRVSSRLSDLIGDSAASRSLVPMLGMGFDEPAGVMRLRNGDLDIEWKHAYSDAAFTDIRRTMQRLAKGMGGVFVDGPSTKISRSITVHPLGGIPMGIDSDHGVVDRRGEVFNYPGLFVADGSVLPGPVGVNPSLTIAALAHLFADHVTAHIEAS